MLPCGSGVTPLAGVWIEIDLAAANLFATSVTPLAGVWIEMLYCWYLRRYQASHSPCGSVD